MFDPQNLDELAYTVPNLDTRYPWTLPLGLDAHNLTSFNQREYLVEK